MPIHLVDVNVNVDVDGVGLVSIRQTVARNSHTTAPVDLETLKGHGPR
jgi:hypothetical protein